MTTVLVVEDEHPDLFQQALKHFGYDVRITKRGDEAVELAREIKPDAIIMDLHLPGMSGIEAMKAIRQFDPSVPIFAVTAYSDRHSRDEAIEAGATLYHRKPVQIIMLLKQLEEHLGGLAGVRRGNSID